jgi:dTDP-4-amino-4,6-dideoxygalactose transaminase
VQSLTYVASFQAIAATGARPVACDVDPLTLTLNLDDAEKRLTSRTKAVMPVHYSGGVGALDKIYTFAESHGLRVIEDAAHAFGSMHQGKRVGGFGDIACFSFDGIKNITSGEGGCIVTSDQSVLHHVRDARLLGVERDTEKRFAGERSWEFDVTSQGWRYHMSNIMAAIGLEQLKRISQMSSTRKLLARRYDTLLTNHDRIKTLPHDYEFVVPHIYVVSIQGLVDRKVLQSQLLEYGIQSGIHYQPNHVLSYFRESSTLPMPMTEAIFPGLLSLPLHADLSESDVDFVCQQLQKILK